MKKIITISLVSILCACSSNYEKRQQVYTLISNKTDTNEQLKLLQQQQKIDCTPQKYIDVSFDCARAWRLIAGVAVSAKQYPLAKQAANNAWILDPPKTYDRLCNNAWYIPLAERETWEKTQVAMKKIKDAPSFAMIHYQALKATNDPKAKDLLGPAYLCELDRSYDQRVQIIQNYLQDSSLFHNPTEQQNLKIFLNEIYKPLEQTKRQFYTGQSDEKSQILNSAKTTILYKNALAQSKKLGLPQIYQEYLQYYIDLYSYRNKK